MNTAAKIYHFIEKIHPATGFLRAFLDLLAWVVAAALALYLRFDLNPSNDEIQGFIRIVPLMAVVLVVLGLVVGLYQRKWMYGSHDEVGPLFFTAGFSSAVVYLLNEFYFDVRPIPQSVVIVGGVFGLGGMSVIRYFWRVLLERLRRPNAENAERIVVYGAGEDGLRVVVSLLRNTGSRYVPIALLDDHPDRQRLSVMGVSVRGGREKLTEIAQEVKATGLLIADPFASGEIVGDLVDSAVEYGLTVKVLPSLNDLMGVTPEVEDIRDLSEEDLLGRHQVETNLSEIAHYLSNRVVLVTGAGGSIGSELCRQLQNFQLKRLVMLDRDESALHAVELSITGRALLEGEDLVLCNVRDAIAVDEIFSEIKPDVVFHAAALKHLPLLEKFPEEAYKTNIEGTLNVLRAAQRVGVAAFVNISTDKAANPTSVLGYSKRAAEFLTSHIGIEAEIGSYISVRFGNVLGSRGSVLVSFRDQIRRGGPVTVTHPDITRYFMTVQEAVQLVIQAGAIGQSGEVLVLDMGQPVKIQDVARRLISQTGENIEIVYTGLRPGEKLHEELFGNDENDERPRHSLISHSAVPPLDPEELPKSESVSYRWMIDVCASK
jgi:FlaA1/EpsC-like NDP-sugar epimerase